MNKSPTLHQNRSYKRSFGKFGMTGGLVATLDQPPAPTKSKPGRPYQLTTQSTSHCRISPENTPCTAKRTPSSHQERTPSCSDSDETRPFNISCSTAPTTSDPDYCQINQIYTTQHYTTATNIHL